MIPAIYYHDIYLLFVLLLAFLYFRNYTVQNTLTNLWDYRTAKFILLIVVLFIGLRPLDFEFADMGQYADFLEYYHGKLFVFDKDVENLIYDNMMMFLACHDFPYPLYYTMIASIYFTCYYICIRKLFPNDSLVMFILFLSAFMTFTSSTNGIKAGAATAIFMVAVAHYDNWKVWIPLLLISIGVHHAMQVPIVAFLCTKLYHNPKPYFYFWIFCLICAVGHVTIFQTLFASYTDAKGASYLMTDGSEWGGKAGFRLDFVLYSAMPVLVGYYAIIKAKFADVYYERILSIYMLANGVWMLCMYMNYNNRLAALSWGMYEVVLFYPVIKCAWPGNKDVTFRKMAWIQVGFTMIMHFVYYAFIHIIR